MQAVNTKSNRMGLLRSQGAEIVESGVRYRTWCEHERVQVLLVRPEGVVIRSVPLEAEGEGYFSGTDARGKAGDLYRYQFNESAGWPDPASRWQPFGVHGPSMVVAPDGFTWSDTAWTAPPLRELIIYELHIGTFTPEGTFRAAIEKLDHLVALGITSIEIMPIADFPGDRNWGYDGVALYAPSRAYGHPDDLRALVNAAHTRGLAIILDAVYNHLGPEGNYVGCYHRDYWNARHKTPWGAGLNFEQPAVRDFFAENPDYWMREFHIDGFRLDATHAIEDDSETHILTEIAARVHAQGGFVVAEDERNEPKLIRPREHNGFGLDGCWADDFHHVVRVMLTGEREGYYQNYDGLPAELEQTLTHGWLFRGQTQKTTAKARGGDPAGAAAEQFIYCISNHDQVGNRALGERLGHSISAAAYRAASALLCLVPQTPMLFMGQEWNASTPFQYFTSHSAELGRKIMEGRRREFENFAAFRDQALLQIIPDSQAESTFENSRLRWEELEEEQHAGVLALYREFLALRRSNLIVRDRTQGDYTVVPLDEGIIAIFFRRAGADSFAVLCDLVGGHEMPNLQDPRHTPGDGRKWQPLLSSNETRFGGEKVMPFQSPITLVLEGR